MLPTGLNGYFKKESLLFVISWKLCLAMITNLLRKGMKDELSLMQPQPENPKSPARQKRKTNRDLADIA
jgi:hypothetical protein